MAPDRAIYAFTLSSSRFSPQSLCISTFSPLLSLTHTQPGLNNFYSLFGRTRVAQTRRDVSILKRPPRLEANLQASALIRVIIPDETRAEANVLRTNELPRDEPRPVSSDWCNPFNVIFLLRHGERVEKILCSREQKNCSSSPTRGTIFLSREV